MKKMKILCPWRSKSLEIGKIKKKTHRETYSITIILPWKINSYELLKK